MSRAIAEIRRLRSSPLASAWSLAAVLSLLFHAVWEGHGVVDPAFRNPDVAGIAYNARLLAEGLLPYVHSAEIKPPGAFLLFAPLLDVGGMRAVWAAAVLWGSALSLATGALAASCWGPRAGPRAAVVHAACAVLASDGDINYSFWMSLPFTLAAVCACRATQATALGQRRLLWASAGALALFAVSIKPSAWTLLVVFGTLLGRELFAGRVRVVFDATLSGLLGAELVALAISLPYALAGRFDALVMGLASVARFGSEYVGVVRDGYGGRFSALTSGLPCLVEQLPGPFALALAGSADLFARRRRPFAFAAWTFALAALAGVATTLRFFSHDNAQLWPALAVLAVRPAGLVARLIDRLKPWPLPAALLTAAVALGAAYTDLRRTRDYVHFMGERDHMIAGICRSLAPKLPSEEPVLAWGWHAWGVYEHCRRAAPGPVFKVLAHVTTVNTNTCNNGFGPMKLRSDDGPARLLEDFRRRPPSLFLWSTYFKEMGEDPLDGWTELRALLEARYSIVDVRGPFVALLRNDLTAPDRMAVFRGAEDRERR